MAWKKRHKYSAVRVKDEDGSFDSKREHRHWHELKLRQQAGEISNLSRDRKECTFELHGVDGSLICRYVADFIFVENGKSVAADSKGMKTDVYKIKRKMFLAEHGVNWEHREM